MRKVLLSTFLVFWGYAPQLCALDFEWGDFNAQLDNRITIGAAWRMEERDERLLAKLNVPGQQNLCTADDCLSLGGDPEPIRRLVNAKGGFSFTNADNGNMNYDQYDPVSGLARIDSKLSFSWNDYFGKITTVGFFDEVNRDFRQTHLNTRWQDPHSRRTRKVERRFAKNAEIREAFIGGVVALPYFDSYELNFSIGKQRLRWGEANLHLFNTLDFINPLDAGLARMPGLDLSSINTPAGLFIMGMEVSDTVSVEFFYQYDWEVVRPDPAGSFLSTNDLAGGGVYAILGLGQFSEDPNKQYVSNGAASLISSATRTVVIEDEDFGFPEEGGQYGLKVSWYAEDFFNGTEFGFHASNYHSRLPYASTFAAQASCTRDAAIPGDLASALVACNGFNGSINVSGLGREPLPVDTMRIFIDYPEDIQLYGVSFNSELGSWSIAGEYNFHNDLPIQVLQSDLIFASAQNAAPPQDVPLGPLALTGSVLASLPAPLQQVVNSLSGALPSEANLTLPGARSVFPDLLTGYRGRVPEPGEYIPGYERMQLGQLILTGVRIFPSSNPIGADQIVWVLEAGLTHVLDMPKIKELAFQGAGDFSHPTPGSDGTGQDPNQPINTLSINPTQQTDGFAEDFSWGMRTLIQLSYNDAFSSGINLLPTLIWFEDIQGISPSPMQNYVEGRRLMVPGLFFEASQAISGSILYQYHGGDLRNTLRDRDNLSVSLAYNF